jgi:hypothetical protein
MTKLGKRVPQVVSEIRYRLTTFLVTNGVPVIDASHTLTGKDFLLKIWNIILSVPLGIAIVDKSMNSSTLSNIFYEVGLMQAYGKETLIIKTKGTKIPSDLVRTEYLEFDETFEGELKKYLYSLLELADHYETLADQLENNPLLAIDFLRRSYLISGDEMLQDKANSIYATYANEAPMLRNINNCVEKLLAAFSVPPLGKKSVVKSI